MPETRPRRKLQRELDFRVDAVLRSMRHRQWRARIGSPSATRRAGASGGVTAPCRCHPTRSSNGSPNVVSAARCCAGAGSGRSPVDATLAPEHWRVGRNKRDAEPCGMLVAGWEKWAIVAADMLPTGRLSDEAIDIADWAAAGEWMRRCSRAAATSSAASAIAEALLNSLCGTRAAARQARPGEFASPAGTHHPIDSADDARQRRSASQGAVGLERHPMIGEAPLLLTHQPSRRPLRPRETSRLWRGSGPSEKGMKGRYPNIDGRRTPWPKRRVEDRNAFDDRKLSTSGLDLQRIEERPVPASRIFKRQERHASAGANRSVAPRLVPTRQEADPLMAGPKWETRKQVRCASRPRRLRSLRRKYASRSG